MASARVETVSIEDCPVCMDPFKDPRTLDCGHHFCADCLLKISNNNAEKSINCPTCRFTTEGDVMSLLKYRTNEFKEMLANLQGEMSDSLDKLCMFCESSTKATMSCSDCRITLCAACADSHRHDTEEFKHEIRRLSRHQFCKVHPENFVSWLCSDCDVFTCLRCVSQHKQHKKQLISEAGDQARARMMTNLSALREQSTDHRTPSSIAVHIGKLKAMKEKGKQLLEKMNAQLEAASALLTRTTEGMNDKIKAESKELEMLRCDVENFTSSKENYFQTLGDLIAHGSCAEVLSQKHQAPSMISGTMEIEKLMTSSLRLENLEMASNLIEEASVLIYPVFTEEEIFGEGQPITSVTWSLLCKIDHQLKDLIFLPGGDKFLVRTGSEKCPIMLYDSTGTWLQTLGQEFSTVLAQGNLNGVAMDTKRNRFILPLHNGDLLVADAEFKATSYINVCKSPLNSVTYCAASDTYIVTTSESSALPVVYLDQNDRCAPDRIFEVKPRSPFSVRELEFDCAQALNVNAYEDSSGKALIAVSDLGQTCVSLWNLDGEHVEVFSFVPCPRDLLDEWDIERDDEVIEDKLEANLYPNGLSSDPAGRILVCDDRLGLLSLWLEDGQQKHQVLATLHDLQPLRQEEEEDTEGKEEEEEAEDTPKSYMYLPPSGLPATLGLNEEPVPEMQEDGSEEEYDDVEEEESEEEETETDEEEDKEDFKINSVPHFVSCNHVTRQIIVGLQNGYIFVGKEDE